MNLKRCIFVKLCSLVISIILIVGGLVLAFIWPVILKYVIDSNMVLTPQSHIFDLWKKFPEAITLDFHFFNWTNPEDIRNKSIKPKFQQIGPYRFYETKEKANITWNNNGTVTFKQLRFWYYDRKRSNGNIQDAVTTLNPVAVSAAYATRSWSFIMRKGVSLSLSTMISQIHLTRTVSQMLFEGYDDPLIKLGQTLPMFAGLTLPPWDKFGWFYTRNGSRDYEGIFNMGTGHNSVFGKLYNWNHWSQTPHYKGNCAKVKGSAGEMFPPYPNNKSISLFSPDLCRTLTLTYVGEKQVGNILGYKYAAEAFTFDNGTLFPENKCFCNGECIPSGLSNVSSCRYGSPSFASLPHFYNADPYYINSVEGLAPQKNKHEFFIVLEPTTGIPLEVNARLQINLLLQPVPQIRLYEDVPKIFFPMLWFEQKVKIPDSEVFMLTLLLNMPVICCTVGILIVFAGIIMCCCVLYKICTINMCGRKKKARRIEMYKEQRIPLKLDQSDIVKTP